MYRRGFLAVAVAGLVGGTLAACAPGYRRSISPPYTLPPDPPRYVPERVADPVAVEFPRGPGTVPRPDGPIYGLPGEGTSIAWTVDDGASTDVVRRYVDFAGENGIRLTFFLNGIYTSWAAVQPVLQPMVDSGQVQLANHTWSHAALTTLSDAGIAEELERNDRYVLDTFGVSTRPYYRPPYGYRDDRTDAAAAAAGFTACTMWYGTLGDAANLTPDQIVAQGEQWMTAQRIVLGHANVPGSSEALPRLLQVIRSRGLRTVTLDDYFS